MKIKDIKEKNTSKILNYLRKNEGISKKDLSEGIKLSPSTVTDLCAPLLKEKIIEEIGMLESDKPGRKKVLLKINYDYKKVIGIDIKKNKTTIIITNLKGDILNKIILELENQEPEKYLKQLLEYLEKFLLDTKISFTEILGIGIGVVGAVDSVEGKTIDFIGFWNEEVFLKKIFEKKFNVPIIVSNNVKNLAIQQMFINNDLNDFFLLKYGIGVGGSLVIGGELLKKDSAFSGEVGHSIVIDDNEICPICKRRGCFENNFSEKALIKKVKKIFNSEKMPILYNLAKGDEKNIDFKKILKAGSLGENEILILLEEASKYLGIILLNMFTLFYPKKIILCGEIFKNEIFINYLFSYIHQKQILDFKKIIVVSEIDTDKELKSSVYPVIKEKFYNI